MNRVGRAEAAQAGTQARADVDALVERVRERILLRPRDTSANEPLGQGVTPAVVVAALRAEGVVLADDDMAALAGRIRQEFDGYGRLTPLLARPDVTDVLVNGVHGTWIDTAHGLERVEGLGFRQDAQVRALAQRLADSVGRRLDDASPWVDAHLADGTRLHALIPPVSLDGTVLSLRIPARRGFDLPALQLAGAIDEHAAAWLRSVIDARLTFLITGGTGSGKTTVLGALLGAVAPSQRIVIVEDSTELNPVHPHVVRLQARPPNAEGAGAVLLRDLVRQALRMRPDRIVVGEVRGAEIVDLLTAFNTGHEGCGGTVHANEPGDVPARLSALALTAGVPQAAVHALMLAGLEAIVHVRRERQADGAVLRVIDGIHVVVRDELGMAQVVPAVSFTRDCGLGAATVGQPAAGLEVLIRLLRLRGCEPPLLDRVA